MLIIYEPDKKDKNIMDFLKVDVITIKMILHLVSLAKKSIFYKTCPKCAPWRWWRHTWSHRAELPITLTHSSLVMSWICWMITTLSSAIVFGLFWCTWQKAPKIENWWIQIWWMWWPFWNAKSVDQPTCKATIQPFHSDVSCMGVALSYWNHCSSWCTPRRAMSVL